MHTRFLFNAHRYCQMVSRKSVLQNSARIHLANYLRSIGDVPLAASARAQSMRERVRVHRLGNHVDREQVFRFSCGLYGCTD